MKYRIFKIESLVDFVKCLGFALLLSTSTSGAASVNRDAQVYLQGSEALLPGGGRLPLPPGKWQLAAEKKWAFCDLKKRSNCGDGYGKVYVFENIDRSQPVYTLVVRRTDSPVRNWSLNWCYEANRDYKDTHATQNNDSVRKCSRGWDEGLALSRSTSPNEWYWRDIFELLPKAAERGKFKTHLEVNLQAENKRTYSIDIFVARDVASDGLPIQHATLMDWKSRFVTAAADGLYNDRPMADTTVLALSEMPQYTPKEAENLIQSGQATRVIKYLQAIGSAGNPEGWRLLARVYSDNNNGLKNQDLAYRYALKGTELGDADSHRALGWILLESGPYRDPKRAADVWERGAALGSCPSASNLGVLYKNGGSGKSPADTVPVNFALAKKWFERSISCGNPVASKWMGDLYQFGLGVDANQETATSYYMAAAMQGVPEAQYVMGQRFQNGITHPKDLRQARYWYEQAVESAKKTNDGNTFFRPEMAGAAISLLATLENTPQAVTLTESSVTGISAISRGDSNALPKVTPKPQAADLQPRANRKALIFGNDAYASVPKLENAKYDALAIADGLQRVGYQVFLETDATRSKMNAAIRKFKTTIEGGDEVAIFYAGHAVQIANTNYLLPIDLKADSEDQIKDDAVPLQRLLDDVADRNAKFTLAIIDACRDNPFKSKNGRSIGGTRGLSPTTAATGQMIVFSAGSGQQALDKLGPDDESKNGLFTRTFLKHIDTPGVSVDQIVRDVREEVVKSARSVGHEQVPAIYDQVIGRFYFRN